MKITSRRLCLLSRNDSICVDRTQLKSSFHKMPKHSYGDIFIRKCSCDVSLYDFFTFNLMILLHVCRMTLVNSNKFTMYLFNTVN